MNEQTVAMEKPDPQSEIVHVSERFRVARRNALIWSSATILAALATDACGQGITLGFGMTGFAHHPNLIVSLALIVLAFMLSGFFRAEREIKLRNSAFAHSKSITEIAAEAQARAVLLGEANARTEALLKACSEIAEGKSKELNQLREDFTLYSNDILNYSEEIDKATKQRISHTISKIQAEEKLQKTGAGATSGEIFDRNTYEQDIHREQRKINEAQRLIDFHQSEIKDRLEDQRKLVTQIEGAFSDPLRKIGETPAKMEPEWSELAGQLSTLSNAIGNEDKFWLKWYDVRAVWMLSGVAIIIAVVKLFAPHFITTVLNFAGFAVTTAESCPT